MAIKIIHGFNIEYTEGDDALNAYLYHLENTLTHEEFNAFIEEAKHNSLSKAHLEDKSGNKFTLVSEGDDKYLLRKRLI